MASGTNGSNKNNKKSGGREPLGVTIILVSFFFLLCLIYPDIFSVMGVGVRKVVTGLLGAAAFAVFTVLLLWGIFILRGMKRAMSRKRTAFIVLMCIFGLMLLQLATTHKLLSFSAGKYISAVFNFPQNFSIGGLIFGLPVLALKSMLSIAGAYVIVIALFLLFTLLLGLDIARARRPLKENRRNYKDKSGRFVKSGMEAAPVKPVVNNGLYLGSIIPREQRIKSDGGTFTLIKEQAPDASANALGEFFTSIKPLDEGGEQERVNAKKVLFENRDRMIEESTARFMQRRYNNEREIHREELGRPARPIETPGLATSEPDIKNNSSDISQGGLSRNDDSEAEPPIKKSLKSPFEVVFPPYKEAPSQYIPGEIINGESYTHSLKIAETQKYRPAEQHGDRYYYDENYRFEDKAREAESFLAGTGAPVLPVKRGLEPDIRVSAHSSGNVDNVEEMPVYPGEIINADSYDPHSTKATGDPFAGVRYTGTQTDGNDECGSYRVYAKEGNGGIAREPEQKPYVPQTAKTPIYEKIVEEFPRKPAGAKQNESVYGSEGYSTGKYPDKYGSDKYPDKYDGKAEGFFGENPETTYADEDIDTDIDDESGGKGITDDIADGIDGADFGYTTMPPVQQRRKLEKDALAAPDDGFENKENNKNENNEDNEELSGPNFDFTEERQFTKMSPKDFGSLAGQINTKTQQRLESRLFSDDSKQAAEHQPNLDFAQRISRYEGFKKEEKQPGSDPNRANPEPAIFIKDTKDTPAFTKDMPAKDISKDISNNAPKDAESEDYTGYYIKEQPKKSEKPLTFVERVAGFERKIDPKNQINMESYLAGSAAPEQKKNKTKRFMRYIPPPSELLVSESTNPDDYGTDYQSNATMLEETLKNLKLPAKVIGITRGPAVTRYELEMPPGTTVKRIEGFSQDIAYALASHGGIRIEAPIPGKRAVGVEVPNSTIGIVGLRDLIDSPEFNKSTSYLSMCIGKDIAGKTVLCNLEKMPHLLIAGSTGSGKSACLHSLIISILYKASPADVRLVLIDPKRVEFPFYKNLPHLLINQVINEREHAINAFKWVREEMEARYKLLAKHNVRNQQEFNACEAVRSGEEERLPSIVIVVDELSDLMQGGYKKEMEEHILSIAQKARASGVHLILATQRPSVDVITGTIKVNLPSRIALAVSNATDSKTILDQGGAEMLLGRGDLLYAPIEAPDPRRIQGAYVTGAEVESIVRFIQEHNSADFYDDAESSIMQTREEAEDEDNEGEDENIDGYDPVLEDVARKVIETNQASTSMIQRRFKVGYARAARIMDQLEHFKFIAPMDPNRPTKLREVFITREIFREFFGKEC